MTARPILFSAAMVRAVLAGRKTQTRRMVEQPSVHHWRIFQSYKVVPVLVDAANGHFLNWRHSFAEPKAGDYETQRCGKLKAAPGDLLWVRETWADLTATHGQPWEKFNTETRLYDRGVKPFAWHQADGDPFDAAGEPFAPRWRPSIHMPRWASRLTLPVTDVRVERLQDISEDDAKAEGAPCCVADDDGKFYERTDGSGTYRCGFAGLWELINGKREGASWDDNPWVAAISFDVIHQNVDAVPAQRAEATA